MWNLKPSTSAIVVVDMQRDFVEEGRPMEVPMARKKAPAMRELIDAARTAELPIIFTQHVLFDDLNISPLEASNNPRLESEGMRAGTDGIEIVPAMGARDSDYYVQKHRYDAFHNTRLETLLTNVRGYRAVDTVIVAGTLTEVCCESTARSAFMRDYKVVFADDATGALSESAQTATTNVIAKFFGRVMSNRDIITSFEGSRL
ncbi:cysteine hydrolase family protein [Brevibacterium sp. CFH 10365]|uniref:cysteine hydrolase family protein n=1 Tax=Brevibacterium sp. CFH 10365 TaxID=2585207 RepID=UPI001266182C|nr:cysteine hydrolase [Brevibacterium sp. CFH 10365]